MKLCLSLLLLIITSCGVGQKSCPDGIKMGCNALFGEKVEDGKDGVDGVDGKDGVDGIDGKDGVDGVDGKDCTVVETLKGADITCGSSTVSIDDGVDSVSSPYDITDILNPCGNAANIHDEVLIKTYNGDYIAYFEDGSNRYLSVLDENVQYRTTDKQKCYFKILSDGSVEEEIRTNLGDIIDEASDNRAFNLTCMSAESVAHGNVVLRILSGSGGKFKLRKAGGPTANNIYLAPGRAYFVYGKHSSGTFIVEGPDGSKTKACSI